jgi:hypothetical protein
MMKRLHRLEGCPVKAYALALVPILLAGLASSALALSTTRTFTAYGRGGPVPYDVDYADASYELRVVPDEEVEELGKDWRELIPMLSQLYPTYADAARAGGSRVLPSVQMIGGKTKQLDDGMYSGMEVYLESPAGRIAIGKQDLLRRLLGDLVAGAAGLSGDDLVAANAAITYVAVAVKLGGDAPEVPAGLAEGADAAAAKFMASPVRSKPIGFYTWTDQLGMIFTRDRWCQTLLEFGDPVQRAAAVYLARTLAADDDLAAAHAAIQRVYERVTNPLSIASLETVIGIVGTDGSLADAAAKLGEDGATALLPYSTSKETVLFNQLTPEEAAQSNLMELLIDKVTAGEVSLKPTDDSGWYSWQQYALEPLLLFERMPEAKKATLDEAYKKRLREAFATMLTKARETHVKQLEPGMAGAAPPQAIEVTVYPPFTCEPLASVYERNAEGYRFLADTLDECLGAEGAGGAQALAEGGEKRDGSIAETVAEARRITLGCYLSSCRDLGIDAGDLSRFGVTEQEAEEALAATDTWLEQCRGDADLARDTRVAVPVYINLDGSVKCWATIGVKLTLAEIRFKDTPKVESRKPGVGINVDYASRYVLLPDDAFVEFTTDGPPLDRDELRALCDREKTPDGIAAALNRHGADRAGPVDGTERRPGRGAPWAVATTALFAGLVLLCVLALRRYL